MINSSSRKKMYVDKPNYLILFNFKKLDDALIKLEIFKENSKLNIEGQDIELYAILSDNTQIQMLQSENRDAFIVNNNNLDIRLKNSMLSVPGLVKMELKFIDESGKMTTSTFYCKVSATIDTGESIKATDEFDLFTKTIRDITEKYYNLRDSIYNEIIANLENQTTALTLGFDNTGTNDNTALLGQLNSNETIKFPKGDYLFKGNCSNIYGKNNIKFIGEEGTYFLIDTEKNISNLILCKNIKIENIIFKDINYDNLLFEKCDLPEFTFEENSNYSIEVDSENISITPSDSAEKGIEFVIPYEIVLDKKSEYMLMCKDGFCSNYIIPDLSITRIFEDGTEQTDYLNKQCSSSDSAGTYRYLSNYFQKGLTKVILKLKCFKAWTCPNGTFKYDLSKICLYKAIKELPDSTDDFTISLQKCENVEFNKCSFIGFKRNPVISLEIDSIKNKNINYNGCKFINNYQNNIDVGHSEGIQLMENEVIRNILATNGDKVIYGKTSSRGISGINSKDVVIKENKIEGTYFGAEIWDIKNYRFEKNNVINALWGYSISNNSYGSIDADTFELSDFWRHGIEIAGESYANVNNVILRGKTTHGVAFSCTDVSSHFINLTNVDIEECMLIAQFNSNIINAINIYVNSLVAKGFLDLSNRNLLPSQTNVLVNYSNEKIAVSHGYVQEAIKG